MEVEHVFKENGRILKKFNKVFNLSVDWAVVLKHIFKESSEEQRI
tara:strand:- start:4 stop:138 length:135 start_codon:yes stop_codon:yes gene_type:complete